MVKALSPKPCQRSSVKRQRIVFLLGTLQGTCFSTIVFLVTGVVLARQCIQHVKTSEEGLSQTPAGNTSRLVNRSNEICQFFAGSARNMACWLAGRSQDTVADGATARKLKHYPSSYRCTAAANLLHHTTSTLAFPATDGHLTNYVPESETLVV